MKKKLKKTFSGDLSVKSAHNLQQELLKMLENDRTLEVRIDNPENVDLSFLQLLFAFEKEAGDRLKLHFKVSDEISELLAKAGFGAPYIRGHQ